MGMGSHMLWNWQQPDWPDFRWDPARLNQAEQQFLIGGGIALGAALPLGEAERDQLQVELMSAEALTTSEIEGEILDRASVQSSIRRQLGLAADPSLPAHRRVTPGEYGIAEMTVDACRFFAAPLTEETLLAWHAMITNGRRDLTDIGRYRAHADTMQVVSGRLDQPQVHFEAPPSARVPSEMARFLDWFNRTESSLPALTRAGIAHLYFVSIHPFEDGNGRVGRAVAEKALWQGLGQPMVLALSPAILARRTRYYDALEAANKSNEATDWLAWFAGIALEAQRRALAQTLFVLDKSHLLHRLRGALNDRQEKALLRMFREGPQGFEGGISAKKYVALTGASPPTATRDLSDLVEKGALVPAGEFKGRRYHLNVPLRPPPSVTINGQGEVIEG